MKFSSTPSFSPLYPFIRYCLLLLGVFTLARVAYLIWQFDRVQTWDHAISVMLYGLRFDIIVICMLWFIPALLLLLLPENRLLHWIMKSIVRVWLSLTTLVIVFVELSTPAFIDQYDTRPNRLFFEYLETPVEVLKTSVYEYPWHVAIALIVMLWLGVYLSRLNSRVFSQLRVWPVWLRLVAVPVLSVLFIIGARSSFDHRPANASTAAFTNDQLVNKLGLNSIYTVLSAYYNLRHEESDNTIYGTMDEQEMVAIVRRHSRIPADSFVADTTSTWHQQSVPAADKPYNLVIILEESLGAGFVGKLGGIGVTPELDKLAEQGLWFTQLYATGTRSARGIEAVVTGFPPSPSRSVLKLGLAQQNFSTLASILKQFHYDTQFIYGGESHFDNMAGFFLANGFDRVTDQNDYKNPKFRATWGVSDEDLLQRVDEELMAAGENPQFILTFSSSNHSPFEFPDNTIELHDAEKQTVNNAVKYADYAIGRFFDKARTQPYWDNTIFLVVADHDTRVFGASLVPVNKFHIPGVILGPGIEPRHYTRVASQIDLAPTLLRLLGISSTHPMIGHDLLSLPDDFPGRALMQYSNNHAYRVGDDVVIHQPDKQPKQFEYRDRQLIEKALDPELSEVARAHALWPMYAYREKKYLSE